MAEVACFDDIPRYVEPNPFNYTKVQLAQRKKALLDMKKDYPQLPEGWLEMVYDVHENTPKEEILDIINNGRWETKGKFSGAIGGTLESAMEILEPQ